MRIKPDPSLRGDDKGEHGDDNKGVGDDKGEHGDDKGSMGDYRVISRDL